MNPPKIAKNGGRIRHLVIIYLNVSEVKVVHDVGHKDVVKEIHVRVVVALILKRRGVKTNFNSILFPSKCTKHNLLRKHTNK